MSRPHLSISRKNKLYLIPVKVPRSFKKQHHIPFGLLTAQEWAKLYIEYQAFYYYATRYKVGKRTSFNSFAKKAYTLYCSYIRLLGCYSLKYNTAIPPIWEPSMSSGTHSQKQLSGPPLTLNSALLVLSSK